MAVYRENELAAVLVIIRMFVAPSPIFRPFFSLQPGEFPMCPVLSLLPGLVGTGFVVVPIVAILMVAVVVSVVGAVSIPIFGLDAYGAIRAAPTSSEPRYRCNRMYFSFSGIPLFWDHAGSACTPLPLAKLRNFEHFRDFSQQ